jgi:meckelin
MGMPLLEIFYTERMYSTLLPTDTSKVSMVPVVFMSQYVTDTSKFWSDVSTSFIVLTVLALLGWAFAAHNWSRKSQNRNEALSVWVLFSWSAIGARFVSAGLYTLLFLICFIRFIGLKYQNDNLALIPADDRSYIVFDTAFWIILATSGGNILYILWNQCLVDLFLIDWEKPKGVIVNVNGEEKQAPISIWRTVFVANEWCRLQSKKHVPTYLLLILMLILMIGCQYRNLAVSVSAGTLFPLGTPNKFLLFAVNSLMWFASFFGIKILRLLVFDRLYLDDLLQFVDIISMANISVFILDFSYHGFYIHGRSVHPFADTNMSEMSSYLKKEESNLVTKRGLNATDQQTFEVFLSKTFRELYDKIHSVLMSNFRAQSMMNNRETSLLGHGHAKSIELETVKSYETINKFFTNFINNVSSISFYYPYALILMVRILKKVVILFAIPLRRKEFWDPFLKCSRIHCSLMIKENHFLASLFAAMN